MKWRNQLRFLKQCFQMRNDQRFQQNILDAQTDYSLVNVFKYGKNHSEKPIYHICPDQAFHSGFFADYNRTLSLLYFADYYGLAPVVEYGAGYYYRETHPVNGTDNPFEYYFSQPAGISVAEMKSCQTVFRCRKINGKLAGLLNEGASSYAMSEAYLSAMARITTQYIKLNALTEAKIQTDITRLLKDRKTVAVHVRGTDFKKNFAGHPIAITAREYLAATKQLFATGGYERIFLATDDSEAIILFEQEFGDKVCYYQDVTRSDGRETVMISASPRENHHYLLGLEVLRDMRTMARSDALVAGLSQVSYAARIQKKSTGTDYERIIILDRGTNRSGKVCST